MVLRVSVQAARAWDGSDTSASRAPNSTPRDHELWDHELWDHELWDHELGHHELWDQRFRDHRRDAWHTTTGGGHAAGGVLSNSTSGAGRGGRGISETTSGGHHQAGHSPINNNSPGARVTQSATGLGALRAGSPASSTPAVLRTHSGQLVFAGSLGSQPRGHGHAQTPSTNVWARSHPNPGATISPSASYTSPGSGADPRLVIGAALLASGLVAMLAGFLVAELRRRRAPASAEHTTPPR